MSQVNASDAVIYYERREEKNDFFRASRKDQILKTVILLRVTTVSRVWHAPSIPPRRQTWKIKKDFFPLPQSLLVTAEFEKTSHGRTRGQGNSTSTLSLGNRDMFFRTLGIKTDIFRAPSLDSRYYSYCPERFCARAYTHV